LIRIISSPRVFGLLAAVCLSIGCDKQGEGERCELANASLDCESGLACRDATELGLGSQGDLRGAALCCPPPDGTEPTVDVCRGEAVLPDEPGEPPAELPPEVLPDAGAPADAAAP
jgi:hypothetical protein